MAKVLVVTGVDEKHYSVMKKLSSKEERELASLLSQPFLDATRDNVKRKLVISAMIKQCEFYYAALQTQLSGVEQINKQIKLIAAAVKAKKAEKRNA